MTVLAVIILVSGFLSLGEARRARAVVSLEQDSVVVNPDYASTYGACPEDNAVCVAIRMRTPMAASTCAENCDGVAFRLTRSLQPGDDPDFENGCGRCVEGDIDNTQKHWAYDVVFPHDEATGEATPNMDVYNTLVAPSLEKAFGCEEPGGSCQSAAFFAYGATGSGKSFTMGFESGKTDGMMQYGVQQMFDTLRRLKTAGHPLGAQSVYMAFYELYGADDRGSRVFDLLSEKPRGKGERGSRDSVLSVLNYVQVTDADHMMEVFNSGNKKRAVGGTGFNAMSSRSHAVVQLFITDKPIETLVSKIQKGDMSGRSKLVSWLNDKSVQVMFVDLAGSEPAGQFEGVRRAEGMTINKALSALRMCIAAVADPSMNKCSTRSDMLTEMLKGLFDRDRKTGKAKAFTRMLATLNPSADPGQVALSKGTMQYASTVKSIKIATPEGIKANNLMKITPEQVIADLKAQISQREAQLERVSGLVAVIQAEKDELAQENARLLSGGSGGSGELAACRREKMDAIAQLNDCKRELRNKDVEGTLAVCKRETAAMGAVIVDTRAALDSCNEESARMNSVVVEADTRSSLYADEVKDLRAMVNTLLEAKASLMQTIEHASAEVLAARGEQACNLTKIATGLFSQWSVRPDVDSDLSTYEDVQRQQDDRADVLEDLRKLDDTMFSNWIRDRVSGLVSKEISADELRGLKVGQAIDMVEAETKRIEAEQAERLHSGIQFLQGYKKALEKAQPAQVDSANIASVRFDEVVAEMASSVSTVDGWFSDQPTSPGAQMEGLSKQIGGSFCSLVPFLLEVAGGQEKCAADEGASFSYEQECAA